MWGDIFSFLKTAQAVTFQFTVFKEQYNLADINKLDFKYRGEGYFTCHQTDLRNHAAQLAIPRRKTKV